MKKTFGIILLLTITLTTVAQTNFRPGYVITNEGDTLNGKVDYRGDKLMCKVCTFKSKEHGKKKYNASEIASYHFADGRVFKSVTIDESLLFAELLAKGAISIYYRQGKMYNKYYLQKGSGGLVELSYFERNVHIDETGKASDGEKYLITDFESVGWQLGYMGEYVLKSQEFKLILRDSLKDQPVLINEINSIKKPNHPDLIQLAHNYHILNNNNQDFTIYNPVKKKAQYEFTVHGFGINYKNIPSDKQFLMYGLKAYAPLGNESLYIGLGVYYSSIQFDKSEAQRYLVEEPVDENYVKMVLYQQTEFKMVRVPISMRYQYQGKIIKPHASVGLSFYYMNDGINNTLILDLIPTFSLGVSVKVYKEMYLTISHERDFYTNPDVNNSDSSTFSKSTSVGVMLRL